MKKIVSVLAAASMLLGSMSAMAEGIQMGQVEYAAHGTKCFAVMTVAVDGETIVGAKITEYQMMAADTTTGVPNGEAMFADAFANGQVLGSKVVNNAQYSTNMAAHAGSKKALGDGYATIEKFVVGKTISELEDEINGKTKEEMVDAVSGSTLVDTLGYVQGLLEAAKVAGNQTGYYTIYNKTGEKVTKVEITEVATGDVLSVIENMDADAVQVMVATIPGDHEGHNALKFVYTTESGREGVFETLSIETAPITLLAEDAMTGATQISFFAPEAPAAE